MNHPRVGEYIAKLVYVVAENTKFAFDFLLPHHIKIKYVVHSCYGEGFGLGRSTGLFVCHLFEELKTKYFVLDNPNSNREDVAIRFLSPAQLSSVPTLLHILDFRDAFDWNGHYQNALYEVVGYDYFRGGWFHSWFRIADE
ncbi:MAG: hypothetical protein K6E59_02245 [Bacilli bacterium]|nr:hypothetical protein [Bacilli bacterium]